ncbi:hypothetical protein S2M10_37950 [Sphingomonas sp. S2M10]|uniref:hypothetical protein n=1 Tax=Sphingomonas sp. S2M10 TaxID=2705010 RepID=UPI0014571838|nr:hypothetical protein [Sphingomonas sp. S2M10]NLS28783.1 hypothetical protein [Sphingomonas sp. S2M10]
MRILPALLVLPLLAGGCVVKTAANIVTLPVKAGAQAADWATTSQDESDRNYGRKMREKEAREGRERRKRDKECRAHPERCENDPR